MEIFNTNRTLFYRLFSDILWNLCRLFTTRLSPNRLNVTTNCFVDPQYAAYLSIKHLENIEQVLKNAANGRDIKLISWQPTLREYFRYRRLGRERCGYFRR